MGSLILTVIGIVITVIKLRNYEPPSARASFAGVSTQSTLITQLITYLLRFIFHCLQYSFIFRYGNVSKSKKKTKTSGDFLFIFSW
jgi:hypothetical protein